MSRQKAAIVKRRLCSFIKPWKQKRKSSGCRLSLLPLHARLCLCRGKRTGLYRRSAGWAEGVITIAQFGYGIIAVTQFGFGIISLSQFGVGLVAVAQGALGLFLAIGQAVLEESCRCLLCC
ncbi:MAG: hypothetical protein MZU95_16865 [Desulfomicrobium escambiense]|nr:hypothetical protein [Desulfomicrobium escambiense]